MFKKISILLVSYFLIFSVTYAFGPDVQIFPSNITISTFDADYDLNTGNMYVAFRRSGVSSILIYKSTDHGLSWSALASVPTNCGSGTSPWATPVVRLIYSEKYNHLFLFFPSSDKKLCVKKIRPDTGSIVSSKKITGSFSVNESLSVTQKLNNGSLVVVFMEGTAPGDKEWKCESSDGVSWNCFNFAKWGKGGDKYISIAYGPPNNIWYAYSTKYYSSSSNPSSRDLEIGVKKNFSSTNIRLTSNNLTEKYPVVVQTNQNNGTVWVFYTQFGSYTKIKYAYSTDGGSHWNKANYLARGYIADAKFYKSFGNPYVDIAYIGQDGYLYWAWTDGNHPTNWRGKTKVSDISVTTNRNRIAKIIYSPGAPAPGGGVIFSGYNGKGLFFDAPWITASTPKYTLSVSVSGNGSVQANGINCPGDCTEDYDEGTSVTLTAQPDSGYEVESWGGACSSCTGNTCQVTMDADKSCSVTFAQTPVPKYSLSVNIDGNGTVVSDPSGISCPGTCSANYDEGTSVTLTAQPDSGYEVESWGGACSSCTGNTCQVTMDADKSCSVTFAQIETGMPIPTEPIVRIISPYDSWVDFGSDTYDGIVSKDEEISIDVKIPKFEGAVDLYIAIQVPGIPLILINESNQFVLFPDAGIVPFRTNITGPEEISLLPSVPVYNPLTQECLLPEGQYVVYTLILPAGTNIMTVDWEHDPYLFEYYIFRLECK